MWGKDNYPGNMNDISLEDRVLQLVYAPDYRPTKPRGLRQLLKLSEDDNAALRRTIKRLVRTGRLGYASNHLVVPIDQVPKGDPHLVEGTFRIASAGYGFLRPLGEHRDKFDEDIFIPAKYVGTAMSGDTVRVRVRRGREGRFEGMILEIVERQKRQFPGTYLIREGKSLVWLDGAQQSWPIQVGDVRGLPLKEGDKVIVELVRYPSSDTPGEGVIMEVLGNSRNPAVDTIAVIRQFGLNEAFPEEVVEQARQISDRYAEMPREHRRDLTQVPTLTIDPVDARDFDDAISLSKNEKGHWELLVHIADVSQFVPEGTPLDEEAKMRATSVYLPDRVLPMLPELISNHLASLQPDRERLAKTVLMEYTPDGMLVHWEVFNSIIKNAHRFHYEQVDQFLADPQAFVDKLAPEIHRTLLDMHTLAMMLRRDRNDGGAIELTLPEIKIDLDKNGKVKGAHLVEYTDSHKVIEEFMLAANQTVAMWLDDLDLPFLRRVHAPPKRIKLRRLTQFVRSLGVDCEDMEDRFEIQRIVKEVHGSSKEYAINFAILKSLSKAIYQPEHERHYALNMTHYCHFTSPIRRYPDLVVHRVVQKILEIEQANDSLRWKKGDAALSGTTLPYPVLVHLGYHCSDMEQNAEAAERELTKVKLLNFMSKRIGEVLHGAIVTVRDEGFVVQANEIPVEGWIDVRSLPQDRYRYDNDTHSLEGHRLGNRYKLGDPVVVRVEEVDLVQRQLTWSLVQHTEDRSHMRKRERTERSPRSARSHRSKKSNPRSHKKGPRRESKKRR